MLAGDSFSTILNLQNSMLSFHSSASIVDASSAPWWSWPFMFRLDGVNVPRWFDITYLPNNVDSTITVLGNPAVWWIGFAAVIALTGMVIYKSGIVQGLRSKSVHKRFNIKQADLPIVFIVVVFFFSWLPYIIISRATYIYHFYLSVPLTMFSGNILHQQILEQTNRKSSCHCVFCGCCNIVHSILPCNFRDACFKSIHT